MIYFNGTSINNYESIYFNGTKIDTVYLNGTKVYGWTGEWETLTTIGLAPDSCSLASSVSNLNAYPSAFSYGYYSQGSGCADSTWVYGLNAEYRMVTSDGTFYGSGHFLWQGRTVTGADTSHNGGTTGYLQKRTYV